MTESLRYVVNIADDGAGWALRHEVGGSALSTHRTKAEAVERAKALLRAHPGGGELLSLNTRSRDLEVRRIPEDGAAALPGGGATAAMGLSETIQSEGEQIDLWLPWILLFGAALGSATISPEVAGADDWIAVFLATLAWSGGWALSTYVLSKGVVAGVQAFLAVGGCFVASLTIANFLGVGVLDIAGPVSGSPAGIAAWLLDFTSVAITTYGWLGALLGAGVGFWLGYRISMHA